MTEDRELVLAFVAGDRSAFEEIIVRYERRVFSVCLRMCGDQEDARDAAQETFVTAYRSLQGFRGDAQLSTWLHRVAVNASLDLLRKRSKRPTAVEVVPEATSDEPGPEEVAVRSDRAAAVHAALAKLSEDHRAVIVLFDLQGLQYPEVAQALDVPVGTVKSRLHRARVDLARLLGHLREPQAREPQAPKSPLT